MRTKRIWRRPGQGRRSYDLKKNVTPGRLSETYRRLRNRGYASKLPLPGDIRRLIRSYL
jgi:hypothetical protein